MELTKITFKLPPRGLIIRDFVIAAISSILDDAAVKSIKNEGNKIVIETPFGMESYVLNQVFQMAQRIVESKLKLMFSPMLVGNDANVVKKFQRETKINISEEASLLDFAFRVLEWASKESCNSTSKFLMSYNLIKEKPSALILGGDKYAALQLFKVEKYEYGRDFLRDYEAIKMRIKHDVYWLALLMAGLSLTYFGRIENELIFITIPEDFSFYEKEAKTTTHLFFKLPARILYDKISLITSRIKFVDPIFAFLQLISYALTREWYRDFDLELLSQAPIQIYRVRSEQTCTLVEKNIADLLPFVRFAYKLLIYGGNRGESVLGKIENLLRNYYELDYSNYYSISMKLYQTIVGSYNVYDLIYELGRLLAPITNKKVFNEGEIKAIVDVFTT